MKVEFELELSEGRVVQVAYPDSYIGNSLERLVLRVGTESHRGWSPLTADEARTLAKVLEGVALQIEA